MSLGIESMSPADIAACCGGNNRNNDGMFGDGNGLVWLIVLFLFAGWGRNGLGVGGGQGGGYPYPVSSPATQADLAAGFNNSAVLGSLNELKLGQAGINQNIMSGFAGVDNAICTLGYQTQQGLNGISREIADCCCATQRAIDGVNYNMATQACETRSAIYNSSRDIIDNANANSRAILDFLTQDKIATLTAENQSLKFQASQSAQNAFITANQEAQTAELIRRLGRDCPSPAFIVPNPNCCYNACGVNSGCGSF